MCIYDVIGVIVIDNTKGTLFVYAPKKKSAEIIWLFRKLFVYLQAEKENNEETNMEATVLNPTQMHLLKLFAFNNSEEYAREVQEVLLRHFQSRLDAEADRLWDEGILNQDKLDEIRKMDLHSK